MKKIFYVLGGIIVLIIIIAIASNGEEKKETMLEQQLPQEQEQKQEQSEQSPKQEESKPEDSKEIQLPKQISGLTTIRIGGGIWENWDADIEKDGLYIEIVYLDSQGEIISDKNVETLPISADVKMFGTDVIDYSYKKGRLVFSAHYSKEQIIFKNLYPKIRIPKEEISVNPDIDLPYGYVSVTIHTPEQGDFSYESGMGFIFLYEEKKEEEKPKPEPEQETDRDKMIEIFKTEALAKWGNDYSMVNWEVKKQTEAYDWIIRYAEYSDILENAKQKWSNDYAMVKWEYEKQLEAYEWINRQIAYPEIMMRAKQKWDSDYAMVKWEYEKQVEAYENL